MRVVVRKRRWYNGVRHRFFSSLGSDKRDKPCSGGKHQVPEQMTQRITINMTRCFLLLESSRITDRLHASSSMSRTNWDNRKTR
jgi:hypothetical protein